MRISLAVERIDARRPPCHANDGLATAADRHRMPSVREEASARCRRSSSAFGEATGPAVSGALGMYGSHTAGMSTLAQVGRIEWEFRKRDEEKLADAAL
jgi:hypothetical protein